MAQFVAGDPLSAEQQAVAQRLIASCGACAGLAADLPTVSRVVAQEPMPSRRRDFRLDPEQAAELRGNALTRFLRRLSLPGSRAFQPAAAGVLSIGLLLVVAGYAWPEGGTVTVQAEPNLIDWTSSAPSLSSADAAAEAPAALMGEPGAEVGIENDVSLDGAARSMDDSEFADSLADSQAGLSEGGLQKSQAQEAEPAAPESGALQREGLELEMGEEALGSAVDEETDARAGERVSEDVADPSARPFEPERAAVAAPGTEESATEATGTAATSDDGDPVEWFVILGLVLALGGGGLLLLGWLARRARDPLAP